MAEYTLESLVAAILDLSQADFSDRSESAGNAGRWAVRPANVATIAASVLSEGQGSMAKAGIQVVDRIDPDVPCVSVCPTAVRQMIRHLLGIATGSCDAGSTVVLASIRDDELLKISVVDDGQPFTDEDIPDDLYNTLDAVILRTGDGESAGGGRVAVTPMGLTLAVIHALLARQGGMLEVANRASGGKQITLAFPLDESAVETEQAAEADMAH
jgi:signal transduction histidine kinase